LNGLLVEATGESDGEEEGTKDLISFLVEEKGLVEDESNGLIEAIRGDSGGEGEDVFFGFSGLLSNGLVLSEKFGETAKGLEEGGCGEEDILENGFEEGEGPNGFVSDGFEE
jgi:hypothetical protein